MENPSKRTGEQTVFMSELLKRDYPATCGRLVDILQKHQVNFKFLKGTEDIWCRDYMPVQNRYGKLIQFKYEPSYLTENEEWRKSISDVEKVCQAAPHAIVMASHLDSVNHALLTRKDIKVFADRRGLSMLRVPEDGECTTI